MAKGFLARTLVAAIAVQSACSTLPPADSIERIRLDAAREAAKSCVRTYSRRYPSVPAMDVWHGCWQAYGQVRGDPQRVSF